MKLWKRAAAALKDRKSLLAASFSWRSSFRSPDLEAAVIKSTSHDESFVDYRNAHRVYKWIRASPANLRPFVYTLSSRVDRTRSWIVALKSLMLIHGVLCLKVPAVEEIRRLPFDLSSFSDGHSRPSRAWGFNAFVRAYFGYLDHYSSFLSDQLRNRRENRKKKIVEDESMIEQLSRILNLQSLLDMLLQIRPTADNMKKTLILEAMDCVVIEIFDIYGRICSAIAKILVKIDSSAGKNEASTALKMIQKATAQGDDLRLYFEFCKEFGVSNANEIPKFVTIPEEDIRTIQNIINGVEGTSKEEESEEEKTIILMDRKDELKTIITEKWEIFEEGLDLNRNEKKINGEEVNRPVTHKDQNLPLILIDQPVQINHQEIPDLITF